MTTYWHDLDLADGRDRSAMRRGTSATARPRGAVLPRRSPRHRGWHFTMRAKILAGVICGVIAGLFLAWTVEQGAHNWAATRAACEAGQRADVNCPLVGTK